MAKLESEIGAAPAFRPWLPTAAKRLRATVDLLVALAESDLRFRYGRGPGLVLRWLFEPFALVGIYLILVTVILDRGGSAAGLSLACAIVPFQLVMLSASNAMAALTARRPIVLNMAFRRTLIPLSSVCTETAAFAASFLLIGVMMAIYRVAPTPAILWLPLVLAVTFIVAAAFAYALSLFAIWYRELWAFGLSFVRMLFFIGPGLVPLAETQGTAHLLLQLNPMTGLFESYRAIFYYGRSPEAWQILYPLVFGAAVLAIFVPIYHREQRQFAKVVA
jgi:ABC-type polysaccharide/polyol phosphate export permease